MKPIGNTKRDRRAVAAVEFAVVLPLIVLLLAGALEAARAVMVTHSLQEAAQAGCRVYSAEDSTLADATAIVAEAMSRAGIAHYAIALDPSTKAGIDVAREPVTVTISTTFAEVAWLPPNFLAGATLQGRCVMPADLKVSDGGDANGYVPTDDDNDKDGHLRDDNVDNVNVTQ